MAVGNITSADAAVILTVDGLYSQVPIQGFASDDMFDTDTVTNAETMMGADGNFVAGFVFNPIIFNISLLPSSASNGVFETWYAQENALGTKLNCSLIARLQSIGRSYSFTNGVLTSAPPTPSAKRVLQSRRYVITFGKFGFSPI